LDGLVSREEESSPIRESDSPVAALSQQRPNARAARGEANLSLAPKLKATGLEEAAVETAHRQTARGRRQDGHDQPVRIATDGAASRPHPVGGRPFDLFNAVADFLCWALMLGLMLLPLAFLFIAPALLNARGR
jgi:hypothetical protein